MAERKFYYYVCTHPGGAVSKWAAPCPPWYGHDELKAAVGNFHPFMDAWKDDTGFAIQEIDCDGDPELLAGLLAVCKAGGDIFEMLEAECNIVKHPTNLTEKKQAKTAVPADRSWGTVLKKIEKKA